MISVECEHGRFRAMSKMQINENLVSARHAIRASFTVQMRPARNAAAPRLQFVTGLTVEPGFADAERRFPLTTRRTMCGGMHRLHPLLSHGSLCSRTNANDLNEAVLTLARSAVLVAMHFSSWSA